MAGGSECPISSHRPEPIAASGAAVRKTRRLKALAGGIGGTYDMAGRSPSGEFMRSILLLAVLARISDLTPAC